MNQKDRDVASLVLLEIAEAFCEGAAGPCRYWNLRLAERLKERAVKIMEAES